MDSRIKEGIRPWLPPKVLDLWRKSQGKAAALELVKGSWSDYADIDRGYEDPLILETVVAAARKAIESGSGFERDGLFFGAEEAYWPILGPLFEARSRCEGQLRVIDMGGSLASKFIQNRAFLPLLAPISWTVVEQGRYVVAGRKLFPGDEVSFSSNFREAVCEMNGVDVVLFSSSLHYFEQPMSLLDESIESAAQSVVIDRSPSWDRASEHLAVQKVGLYSRNVQYPCWVLSQPKILDRLRSRFKVVATWDESLPIPTRPSNTGISFLGASGMVKAT